MMVLADSDIAVPPDYLWCARVAARAGRPAGRRGHLYRGRPVGGLWSRLERRLHRWLVRAVGAHRHAGGSRRFAFGATIALRRGTLAAIGGFEALSDRLADDFWLGELARQLGLRTVLSRSWSAPT